METPRANPTIGQLLRATVQRGPERIALVAGAQHISYAALGDDVARRAHRLRGGSGLRSGDRVGLLARNGLHFVSTVLACAEAGLVVVPLNPDLVPAELAHIVGTAGARAIAAEPELADLAHAAADLSEPRPVVIPAERLAEGGTVRDPGATVTADDLLYLGFTSGTTGRPKGAMVTHRNRIAAARVLTAEYGLGPADRHLVAGPLHHTAALAFALAHLLQGASLVCMRRFDAGEALALLEREAITTTFMAPVLQQRLLEAARPQPPRLPHLRALIAGGSPFAAGVKLELLDTFGPVLHEFYGATEAGPVTNLRPDDQRSHLGSAGRAVAGAEIRIVAADRTATLPHGEPGLVAVRNESLFSGYWHDEAATRAVLHDGWLALGDVGHLDADGYLTLVDREQDMVISGGVNVYPREVERVLAEHSGVREVAVIGVPHDTWGEAVWAVVVTRPGAALTAEDLTRHCEGRLAPYKRPKGYDFVSTLPRNASGKVVKRLIAEPYWSGQQRRIR